MLGTAFMLQPPPLLPRPHPISVFTSMSSITAQCSCLLQCERADQSLAINELQLTGSYGPLAVNLQRLIELQCRPRLRGALVFQLVVTVKHNSIYRHATSAFGSNLTIIQRVGTRCNRCLQSDVLWLGVFGSRI